MTLTTILLASTALGLLGLIAVGRWPERLIAGLVVTNIVATPVIAQLQINGWRAGLMVWELLLFLAMWIVCEIKGRWWLTAAAGFQLIVVVSHFVALIGAFHLWTAVSARIGASGLLSLTFFAGALEMWPAGRAYRQEMVYGTQDPPQ